MISCKILADSIAPSGGRLTTFEIVIPRIVLAEFNTHRMFSRNSASSRAIPVAKMIERVQTEPLTPLYWGKNQKGMSAEAELTQQEQDAAREVWVRAAKNAIASVQDLIGIGVHKQIANRLLEPFLWHTVIFSATELTNFYALRDSKFAQPEIREPTKLAIAAYEKSVPVALHSGEWHLPLVYGKELKLSPNDGFRWELEGRSIDPDNAKIDWEYWAKISAARCGRVSYLTHDGVRDLEADLKKFDELRTNGHMSPLEHPAMALSLRQWQTVSGVMATEWTHRSVPVGNFWGFQQLRKTILNEHDYSKVKAGIE